MPTTAIADIANDNAVTTAISRRPVRRRKMSLHGSGLLIAASNAVMVHGSTFQTTGRTGALR
jgi:hypothetical protein